VIETSDNNFAALTLAELESAHPGQLVKERRGGGFWGLKGQAEYRSASRVRPQTRNGREFHDYVEKLLAAQPRTLAGYEARTAALEELCRQTDELERQGWRA